MSTSTTPKKATKRDLILEAAGQCFARYGYDKTTLADIGKASNLNKASLYYYFKNKEEIFFQVTLAESADFVAGLQEEIDRIEGTENRVLHYVLARVDRYQEVLSRNQLTIENLDALEGQFLQLYQQIKVQELEFVRQILEAGVARGEIVYDDVHGLAESLFLISDALKHNSGLQAELYYDNSFHLDAVKDKITAIVRLIFAGLRSQQH